MERVRYKGVRGFAVLERTATHAHLAADDGRRFWAPLVLVTPDLSASRQPDPDPRRVWRRRCPNCGNPSCEGARLGNPCISE